jgi:ketosteroid isomerase-like protein
MRKERLTIVALALTVLGGCTARVEVATDNAADLEAVQEVREAEVTAVMTGDTVLAYMADDIVVMPPGEPQVAGIGAVRAWTQAFLAAVTVQSVSYDPTDITIAGDWAIERYTGSLTMTPAGATESMTERMKGVHVYHRGADGWKMTLDVWNTDAPGPDAM